MGNEITEPVIGCFPCIKRLMIVIMLGTVVTGLLIITARNEEVKWGDIIHSMSPFPSSDLPKANQTFFVNKIVITKGNESNSSNVELRAAWRSLGPHHESQKLLSIIALGLFFVVVFVHFTGFCCCRDRCFSNRRFRVMTYGLYSLGFLIFAGIIAGIFVYQVKSHHNYMSAGTKLSKVKPPQFLNLVFSNNMSKSGELSSEHLEKISIMCYYNAMLTLMDIIDVRHVYPQDFPEHRVIKIEEVFYHTSDLVLLGFCQNDMLTLATIGSSVFTGLICILLPMIGFFQLNRRRPKIAKVHPDLGVGLESNRSEVPPPSTTNVNGDVSEAPSNNNIKN